MTMSDLRERIAAIINDYVVAHFPEVNYTSLADAVIAELGSVPDREFTDDQGRHWEWCGGKPGTWAWRITRVEDRCSCGATIRYVTDWKADDE